MSTLPGLEVQEGVVAVRGVASAAVLGLDLALDLERDRGTQEEAHPEPVPLGHRDASHDRHLDVVEGEGQLLAELLVGHALLDVEEPRADAEDVAHGKVHERAAVEAGPRVEVFRVIARPGRHAEPSRDPRHHLGSGVRGKREHTNEREAREGSADRCHVFSPVTGVRARGAQAPGGREAGPRGAEANSGPRGHGRGREGDLAVPLPAAVP
jgi:hypothetical protein